MERTTSNLFTYEHYAFCSLNLCNETTFGQKKTVGGLYIEELKKISIIYDHEAILGKLSCTCATSFEKPSRTRASTTSLFEMTFFKEEIQNTKHEQITYTGNVNS